MIFRFWKNMYSKIILKKNCLVGFLLGMIVILRSSLSFHGYLDGHTVNILEPFIQAFADENVIMISVIGALIVLADAPFVERDSFFVIHKVGRKKWYVTQWLYMLSALVTYYLVLFLVSILPFLTTGYPADEWSQTALQFMHTVGFTERMQQFNIAPLKARLVDFTPFQTFLLGFFLCLLYSLLLTSIVFIFNMMVQKNCLGTIIAGIFHAAMTLINIQGNMMPLLIQKLYLKENAFFIKSYNPQIRSASFSVCYMILLVYLVYLLGERLVYKVDFICNDKED